MKPQVSHLVRDSLANHALCGLLLSATTLRTTITYRPLPERLCAACVTRFHRIKDTPMGFGERLRS